MSEREAWGTRIGLILAAAGNAIGIGNLLRFPNQAAANGGGAFMIPYIISLLVLGIPMMWVLWAIGRYGGRHGSGNLPGIFDKMWPNPASKYIGVIGVSLPMLFVFYYSYIEAWCLGYAWFSFTGDYMNTDTVHLATYYQEFLGDAPTAAYFPGLGAAFTFMGITLVLNLFVLYRGVAKGIELLAKVAIPMLFVFCMLLIVRVFTVEGQGTVIDGLNFIWTPDFSKLTDANVWLAAAGQIFFTLSIGFGAIEVYASYVKEDDDIALTGLTTASTNEFVEVIFGSMIAIPAAAVFYGAGSIERIANSGSFAIGMISMPEILRSFPYSQFFGSIWFLLLFFAAFTSSVAVSQPVMSFFQDEFKISRGKATVWLGIIWALGVTPVILFYKYGFFTELDFWAGTLGLVVIALIEVVIFAWVFGVVSKLKELEFSNSSKIPRFFQPIVRYLSSAWRFGAVEGFSELDRGALLRIPRLVKPLIQYVIPVLLVYILVMWAKGFNPNPPPKVDVWVAEPSQFAGEVIPGNGEIAEGDQKAAQDIAATLGNLVEDNGGDGLIHASVMFSADGSLIVTEAQGSGTLASMNDPEAIATYLRGNGYQYQERNGENGSAVATEKEVPVVIRGLYMDPYVWGARGFMILITIFFAIMIFIAWKNRGSEVTA
jgi:SNF family Na+-dependent transporter